MAESGLSFASVIERAADIITSTKLDDYALRVFGLTCEGLVNPAASWLEVAVESFDYDVSHDQKEELLDKAMELHRKVSTAMAAHLALTAENIARSTWLSARMLSKDGSAAQAGANEFQRHLLGLREGNRTPYEDLSWSQQ